MTKDELINKLDVIDHFTKDDYVQLEYWEPLNSSDKAVFLDTGTLELWFPFSQLRTDVDGNLYLARWLYDNYFMD